MKKFFACFIVFLLLLTSCNKFIVENIYQQRYDKEDVAMVDVYTHLCYYDIDSIYMDLWIPNYMLTDTTEIEQKSIRKPINKKSEYQFTFSRYAYPSELFYTFLIRFIGREKDKIKEPKSDKIFE
jgi:hypothetical protein